jgi:hypothetical protein
MATKQEYMNKLKNKALPKSEVERRWKQRVMTLNSKVSPSRNITAPAARFTNRNTYQTIRQGKLKDSVIISGQDYIGSFSTPAGNVPGQSIFNTLINPLSGVFMGTRMEKMAGLYDKFLFTKLRFHTQSSKGTSSDGSYLLAYDRDMADETPANGEQALKNYYSMAGTRSAAIWEDCTIDCPLSDTQDFYYTNYTGYDGRLTAQGQLYISILTSVPAFATLAVWVEYEVLLMDPSLETNNTYANAKDPAPRATAAGSYPLVRNNPPVTGRQVSGDIKIVKADQVKDIANTLLDGTQAMLTGGWYEVIVGMTGSAPAGNDYQLGIFSDNPKIKVFQDTAWNSALNSRVVGDFTRVEGPAGTSTNSTFSTSKFVLFVQDALAPLIPYYLGPGSAGTIVASLFSVYRLANGKPASYLKSL